MNHEDTSGLYIVKRNSPNTKHYSFSLDDTSPNPIVGELKDWLGKDHPNSNLEFYQCMLGVDKIPQNSKEMPHFFTLPKEFFQKQAPIIKKSIQEDREYSWFVGWLKEQTFSFSKVLRGWRYNVAIRDVIRRLLTPLKIQKPLAYIHTHGNSDFDPSFHDLAIARSEFRGSLMYITISSEGIGIICRSKSSMKYPISVVYFLLRFYKTKNNLYKMINMMEKFGLTYYVCPMKDINSELNSKDSLLFRRVLTQSYE